MLQGGRFLDNIPVSDVWDWVSTTEHDNFSEIQHRWDEDYNRWQMKPNIVIGKKYKNEITITGNQYRTFSDKVSSRLSAAEMQIIIRMAEVEGEDKREDIGKLERLFLFCLEKADEKLYSKGLPALRDFIIWCALHRGWSAARILNYKTKNGFTYDYMGLDPRWLIFDNNLSKVAQKTNWSKAQIEAEFGFTISGKKEIVVDYFDDTYNHTLIEGQVLRSQKHGMPSNPIIIMPVAIRPPMAGEEDFFGAYGESIYAPIRGIPELENVMDSIWATQANLISKTPKGNYYDDQGVEITDAIMQADAVLNLPMGHNQIFELPVKEVSPTLVSLQNRLDGMRQAGSLTDIDVRAPYPSGTLYALEKEEREKVYGSQIRHISYMYSAILRKTEEQLLAAKALPIKIDGIDEKNKYYSYNIKPVDLKAPHVIKVEFTAQVPLQTLDAIQLAQMAKQYGIPMEYINEKILKVTDPQMLSEMMAMEIVEAHPDSIRRTAMEGYAKLGRTDESERLSKQMYLEDMQKMMMMAQQAQQLQGQQPQQEMPPMPMGEMEEAPTMGAEGMPPNLP